MVPSSLPRVHVQTVSPGSREGVTRVEVDAHDIGHRLREGERVTLVAGPPPLKQSDGQRHRHEAVENDRAIWIKPSHGRDFIFHKPRCETPRLLHPERIHRLMLDLPRDDGWAATVSLDYASHEFE